MKRVSVMIIDDEVLAIDHIQSLVSWQQLGYEIVCTATRPMQALELARVYKPDLAIIDIVMPGMNGLELCRQLMNEKLVHTIVLLTSYKEFEYAKEAVKLGVSNYWVKHEVDKPTLMRELGGLRQEIELLRRRSEFDRDRLLLDWLGGRRMQDEQWRAIVPAGYPSFDSMQLIVMQPDRPFALLPNVSSSKSVELQEYYPLDEDRELLVSIRFLESHYVLVYTDNATRGEGKLRAKLEERASAVRCKLEQYCRSTVSIAIVAGVRSQIEMPDKLSQALQLLSRSLFRGPRQTYRLNDAAYLQEEINPLDWVGDVTSISELLLSQKFEEASTKLQALFERAEHSRDMAGFTELCRQLVQVWQQSRLRCQLPDYAKLIADKRMDDSNWYSVQGIHDWFQAELTLIASVSSQHAGLSRKVRQAVTYMERHYADRSIDTDRIAQHLGISKDHLRHIFKSETGQTLLETLTDIRIERAKSMLDEGTYKVYEIAEQTGFRNSQYFSQVFRKSTGMNPLEYMDRIR